MLGGKKLNFKKKTVKDDAFVSDITPTYGYDFNSDYYRIDHGVYASIVTVLIKHGANRDLFPMWGIQLLPTFNLGSGITMRLYTQVMSRDSKWVEKNQASADSLAANQTASSNASSHSKQKSMADVRNEDLSQIAYDITRQNDSYLTVSFKVLVKANTLPKLDRAIEKLNRYYSTQQRFNGIRVSPYDAEQSKELSTLYSPTTQKVGSTYGFTSTELAGEYNIATQGITDETGEYVGAMVGETNRNAIIWDTDLFRDHVVIASKFPASTIREPELTIDSTGLGDNKNKSSVKKSNSKNAHNNFINGTAMWGTQLSHSALANNHKVVHLVLDGQPINDIGVDLSSITSYIPMDKGYINPLELFGDRKDAVNLYQAHMLKLRLMLQQFSNELNTLDLRKYFAELVERFYMTKKMLVPDYKNHVDDLRLINIGHEYVPTLHLLTPFLTSRQSTKDPTSSAAYQRIQAALMAMEDNGDIFDIQTNKLVDDVKNSPRTIYDFSSLAKRDKAVMMAQFINALPFALHNLDRGDVVILHGTEELTDSVKDHVKDVFRRLSNRHVRVAYLYNDTTEMMNDSSFNRLADADWTLLSGMSTTELKQYEDVLDLELPSNLQKLLSHTEPYRYYLRRGSKNIVFDTDLALDVPQSYKDTSNKIKSLLDKPKALAKFLNRSSKKEEKERKRNIRKG